MESDAVPLLRILDLGQEDLELLLGVIDQRGQPLPRGLGHAVGEQKIDPLADHAGAGVQDVQERLVLPVYVGDEMFAALGEVEDRLEIDDLRPRGAHGRIQPGKHVQIAQLLGTIASMLLHNAASVLFHL